MLPAFMRSKKKKRAVNRRRNTRGLALNSLQYVEELEDRVLMANYDLSTYVFTNAQRQQLPTTTDNHSGVAYSPTRNSLYTVINNPTQIIEYNLAGTQVIRTINLIGFDDTEAIFHLG